MATFTPDEVASAHRRRGDGTDCDDHACLDHSKPYLTADIEVIRHAFELALA